MSGIPFKSQGLFTPFFLSLFSNPLIQRFLLPLFHRVSRFFSQLLLEFPLWLFLLIFRGIFVSFFIYRRSLIIVFAPFICVLNLFMVHFFAISVGFISVARSHFVNHT